MTIEEQQIQQGARLEELILALREDGKSISKVLNVSQSLVSQLINGKRAITHRFLSKITGRYSNVNTNWLLLGTGEMFLPDDQQENRSLRSEGEPTMEEVDRLREEVIAVHKARLSVQQDLTLRQACYRILADSPGATWAAVMLGAGVALALIVANPGLVVPPLVVADAEEL